MATQLEKLPKPVIEKRRRARINRCLEELKHLVPVIDASGNTRLDKADILELTVGYLRNCRNLRVTPYSRIGHAQQAGYTRCSEEVVSPQQWNSKVLQSQVLAYLNARSGNLSMTSLSDLPVKPHLHKPYERRTTTQCKNIPRSTSSLSQKTNESVSATDNTKVDVDRLSQHLGSPIISCDSVSSSTECSDVKQDNPTAMALKCEVDKLSSSTTIWRPWC